jgi:hypothetical protein
VAACAISCNKQETAAASSKPRLMRMSFRRRLQLPDSPSPSYVVHASDVVGRQPATPVPLIEIKEESTELLAIKH